MQFYKISVGRYSSRVNSFNTFSDNLSRYKAARIFNPSKKNVIHKINLVERFYWNDLPRNENHFDRIEGGTAKNHLLIEGQGNHGGWKGPRLSKYSGCTLTRAGFERPGSVEGCFFILQENV